MCVKSPCVAVNWTLILKCKMREGSSVCCIASSLQIASVSLCGVWESFSSVEILSMLQCAVWLGLAFLGVICNARNKGITLHLITLMFYSLKMDILRHDIHSQDSLFCFLLLCLSLTEPLSTFKLLCVLVNQLWSSYLAQIFFSMQQIFTSWPQFKSKNKLTACESQSIHRGVKCDHDVHKLLRMWSWVVQETGRAVSCYVEKNLRYSNQTDRWGCRETWLLYHCRRADLKSEIPFFNETWWVTLSKT